MNCKVQQYDFEGNSSNGSNLSTSGPKEDEGTDSDVSSIKQTELFLYYKNLNFWFFIIV